MDHMVRTWAAPQRERRRTAAVLSVVAVIGMLALGSACQSSAGDGQSTEAGTTPRENRSVVISDDPPQTGGKIVYGLNAETNGWNPGSNQWAPAGLQVMRTVFDTLSAFDESGTIHPYLAQEFGHNADFTEWTITLRPGVTLHNGQPVTAETVVRNQNHLKASPVTKQAYSYIESFEATAPDTVTIRLTEPWVTVPNIFATQIGVVADPAWLESNDGLHPVGTGPFVFEDWKIGDSLTVVRNDSYWQRDPAGRAYPYLDEVEFKVITDNESRAVALEAGDLDILQTASPISIVDFQEPAAAGEYQLIADSGGETAEVFIQLNNAVAPFDDPDARRALAYATDKQFIVDEVQEGLFEPASGPYAPSSPWFAESGYPTYDPAQARTLVDKVKAAHGGEFRFAITGVEEPTTSRTLQLLQQQWADVGIDVSIVTVEQAKLIIQVVTGDFQAVQWQQFDSPNPLNDQVWWSPDNATEPPEFSLNFARYENPAMADLLRRVRQDEDVDAQRAAMAEVQRLMGADVPYVWLYHAQLAIIATPELVNVTRYTLPDGAVGLGLNMGAHPLHQVWLDR
jgi:peptide/nickel transport system substrate-binding protein